MHRFSYALFAVTTLGCSHDRSVSFDPRVSRGTLPELSEGSSSRHPCVETPARPKHASLTTREVAEPAF